MLLLHHDQLIEGSLTTTAVTFLLDSEITF